MTPRIAVLLAPTVLAFGLITAVAAADPHCPPNSNAPHCETQPSTSTSGLPTTTTTQPSSTTSGLPTTTSPPSSGVWTEDFSSPTSLLRFAWQTHHPGSGDVSLFEGDHDMACGAPTTSRDVHVNWSPGDNLHRDVLTNPDVRELVWWCAPGGPDTAHVMTGMDTHGYAQVDFSPTQTLNNVSRVCWDQNKTAMGYGKWIQIVVIDEARFQANAGRLDYVAPWLQGGPGSRGLQIQGDDFLFQNTGDSARIHIGQGQLDTDFSDGFTTTDKARRFRNCLIDQGNGTTRVEQERPTTTKVRVLDGSFPNGPVRVIFSDDSYDPTKHGGGQSFTWHLDRIEIHHD